MKILNYLFNNRRSLLKVVAILLLFILVVIFIFKFNIADINESTEKLTAAFNKDQTNNLDFYQKLKNNKAINMLVIGDSISESDGVDFNHSWSTKLYKWLESQYNVKVKVKALTHPGGGVLNGLSEYSHNIASGYDLIIICYGQNDKTMSAEARPILYEALIRRALKNNPEAEVIPVIESSFQNYEIIPNELKSLSNYYNLAYVDVRINFKESGIDYHKLAPDGIHGSEDGYNLYFKAISNLINKNSANNKHINNKLKTDLYIN